MPMWDDVKRNLMEWYTVTTDKTVEVAKVTSLRYDKFGISRDIERQFSELGNLVYTALEEGRTATLGDPGVTAIVERLNALEKELQAKEEEIGEIRSQHGARQHRDRAATVDDLQDQAAPAHAHDPAPVEATPVELTEAGEGIEDDMNRDNSG
ncbi:hypothetical protein COW53_00270 [bacterium CG17_big_fil_post_rev_8_21_14_2_50_64_8]|nr:MAG: hypothetical protein COW53_00270 [bacterium CG17_big_fil_post_rev_8_21_14_2_50_64_8]PJA74686.1 MAG: hypothetical protein CO151_08830 [bacterium CG_4_9_14_3_um_filter_65_15]